jgi:arginine deiminase
MALGVHSEVGQLRKVMIHRSGLEHSRLTPSDAHERVVETAGDTFEAEREQWDDGNNVVALEPGVVAYERNTGTNTALRKAGIEVLIVEGFEVASYDQGAHVQSLWRLLPGNILLLEH